MTNRIMMHLGGKTRPLTMAPDLDAAPLSSSAGTGWCGLPVERHHMLPWEGDAEVGPLVGEHGVLVYLNGGVELQSRIGNKDVSQRVTPGTVRFLSGDDRPRLRRIVGQAEVLVVHLPTEWIHRAVGEEEATVFAQTTSIGTDETMLALAQQMHAEVNRRGVTGRLFGESLSLSFLSYAAAQLRATRPTTRSRSLSGPECERLRNFIASRFREDLTLSDLAAVVGLRPRHFSSLFRRAFGCSPYRFVLNRRLAEGARLLASTEHDIAEIAYDLGFCSQSHFTSLFRRTYGVTPGEYVVGRRSAIS